MNLRNFRYMLMLVIKFFSTVISLEAIRACWDDQSGGLVLPITGITIGDKDWIKYKSLKVDKTVKAINSEDLPDDFCPKACRLVDEFRRKTVNETVEWMLFFDFKTGEVIYCWEGEKGRVVGNFDKSSFKDRSIASIHSHSNDYYSFPSGENFEILENDFEDYEIITSINALWIVEFKGFIEPDDRYEFQFMVGDEINQIMSRLLLMSSIVVDINAVMEDTISNYLLTEIDKKINDKELILTKKVIING